MKSELIQTDSIKIIPTPKNQESKPRVQQVVIPKLKIPGANANEIPKQCEVNKV